MQWAQSAFKPRLLQVPQAEVKQVSINIIRLRLLQSHWADHEVGQLLDHRSCPDTH